MKFYAFDIETIPNQMIPAECIPKFDPESVKHGNTKDPEKRKAKEDEERAKFEDGLTKTMSLDPAMCSVCTFAGILFDTEGSGPAEVHAYQLTEEDEHVDLEVVSGALDRLKMAYNERLPIVSFNGIAFDLPVLQFRAIAQDIPVDPQMIHRLTRKYTNDYHFDLMQILAGWDRQKWHGQDFYLRLFGVGSKSGMDGSQVYPAYQAGEYEKIKQYCIEDATGLARLFARVYPWIIDVEKLMGGEKS